MLAFALNSMCLSASATGAEKERPFLLRPICDSPSRHTQQPLGREIYLGRWVRLSGIGPASWPAE